MAWAKKIWMNGRHHRVRAGISWYLVTLFFFQGRPCFWGDSFFPHFVQVWWLFHFFSPLSVLVSALRFASLFGVCGCTSHVLLTIPSYYYDAGWSGRIAIRGHGFSPAFTRVFHASGVLFLWEVVTFFFAYWRAFGLWLCAILKRKRACFWDVRWAMSEIIWWWRFGFQFPTSEFFGFVVDWDGFESRALDQVILHLGKTVGVMEVSGWLGWRTIESFIRGSQKFRYPNQPRTDHGTWRRSWGRRLMIVVCGFLVVLSLLLGH